MAKSGKKIDKGPVQLTIFDAIRQARELSSQSTEGSLSIRDRLRAAMNEALKRSPLSRHQVAGEMSHLLGTEITKFMLDSWTAESKEQHRMPAEYLPAFCKATGAMGPVGLVAEAAGCFALPGPDALRSEIQKLDEEEKKIRKKKTRAKVLLHEMER